MRNLSRKQKNEIRTWVKDRYYVKNCGRGLDHKPMFFNCTEDMESETYWELYALNQHECFDSNVDRFVNDIRTVADCKII